jgi:hypothetical protein
MVEACVKIRLMQNYYKRKKRKSFSPAWDVNAQGLNALNQIANFFGINALFILEFKKKLPYGVFIEPGPRKLAKKFPKDIEEKIFSHKAVKALKNRKQDSNELIDFIYERLSKREDLSDFLPSNDGMDDIKNQLRDYLSMCLELKLLNMKYDRVNYITFSRKYQKLSQFY